MILNVISLFVVHKTGCHYNIITRIQQSHRDFKRRNGWSYWQCWGNQERNTKFQEQVFVMFGTLMKITNVKYDHYWRLTEISIMKVYCALVFNEKVYSVFYDCFYFSYQILTTFNKLKIVSEVADDNWKMLKLFTSFIACI